MIFIFNNTVLAFFQSTIIFEQDKYCTGTINDEPAPASMQIFANTFIGLWGVPKPWSNGTDKPGVLSWRHALERGPTCVEGEEDQTEGEFFKNEYNECCTAIKNGCKETKTCPDKCTKNVQNRARFTSPDIGFYYKWDIDDEGYPTNCDIFDKNSHDQFHKKSYIGLSDCPLQDIKESSGKKALTLSQRVVKYAENQQLWINDLVKSFDKMLQNGYASKDLKKGPNNFWTQRCKMITFLAVNRSWKKSKQNRNLLMKDPIFL